MANRIELFLFLPFILLIFPAFFGYIFSPYLILKSTRAAEKYSIILSQNFESIFLLKKIDLDSKTKADLKKNIEDDLLPELKRMFRRDYIDNYFTRNMTIANEKMLTFRETLYLLSTTFGLINLINFCTIVYLHFNSIDLDFLYIDKIINPLNVFFFGILFSAFIALSGFLFIHSRRNLAVLIGVTNYNLALVPENENIRIKTRQIELDSIRRFPIEEKIGRKLAGNWDLVAKLYLDFIKPHLNEELLDYSKREVARGLVLEQYSNLLNKLDLPEEKKKELELQFYLGEEVTGAIDDLIVSPEETESIKLDVLYATKKMDSWEEISNDERISTFLFSWRSIETLFRHLLWKKNAYPTEDQSWLSIVNNLLKEKLLTTQENKTLKRVRLRRNAMLHRSQDRYVNKEDLEDLLKILQNVLDRF
jgi:hypothetical protein